MTTARQIVNGAAEELGVKTAEITLESDDFNAFFNRMNDMLLEWADSGLTPAFKEVFNGDDTIEIDSNARAAIKFALAIRCAPSFQKPITAGLAENARDSLSRLESSTAFIGDVQFPDTLPIGSGNECPDFGFSQDDRFFPGNQKENF
jgi:hypothetical protein